MKRSPIKIGLVVLGYLAAGAAVNLLVAAGCALWSPLAESFERAYYTAPRSTQRWLPSRWLDRRERPLDPDQKYWTIVRVNEVRGPGLGVLELWEQFGGGDMQVSMSRVLSGEPGRILILRAGWPFNCLEAAGSPVWPGEYSNTPNPATEFTPAFQLFFTGSAVQNPPPPRGRFQRGFDLSTLNRNFIPLSPAWPALIANTLVWALFLAALVQGPRLVRGEIRLRRGLCRSCGYPIGVSDKCTECGRELPGWVLKLRGDGSSRAAMSEHTPEG